ncbi:hypothetical protein [Thalassotalea sp. PS06]|uniref:hypothetical protein n=1 Tax=Thalassotalea sp. PS06 TaxID=2594005 RepID=UPI00116396C4|nr:hypothetical protein [Thalassotalea sp. PS06]QDP02384.1 hypothetical protein FNC98_14125 [Thalassotalea sp. PS06]
MTAIITQKFNLQASTHKGKGYVLIGLFLFALLFITQHQASHDAQSNHMHCHICWQFAMDDDEPGNPRLEQTGTAITPQLIAVHQTFYNSAICRTGTCRGPPAQS